MPKAYSNDLRARVLDAYDKGMTYEKVSEHYQVSITFIRCLVQLRKETGALARRPHGGGAPRALTLEDLGSLRQVYEEKPDALLKEMVERFAQVRGIRVSIHTIARELKRMGITRKKKR